MNSNLYNKKYKIPDDIIMSLKKQLYTNDNSDGIKRAKFIINNGYCTYQMLKGLKNFFDNVNMETDKQKYELSGGDEMKRWVDDTLRVERDKTAKSTEAKRPFKSKFSNSISAKNIIKSLTEEIDMTKKNNVVAVIVNRQDKVLLLRRAVDDSWMPDKWALLGGGVEYNEDFEDAIKRECIEECGIELDNFIKVFTATYDSFNDTVFIVDYDGDDSDINLNDERTDYGWFSLDEIDTIDGVPKLIEYIVLAMDTYNNINNKEK